MPEQGAAGLEQDLAALLLRQEQDSQKRRRTNHDLNMFCNFWKIQIPQRRRVVLYPSSSLLASRDKVA